MSKPRVTINSVASRYDNANERTVEFSAGNDASGGLIQFKWDEERKEMTVTLYRLDGNVGVFVPEENLIHG